MIDALQEEENTFEEWTTKNVYLKWQIRFCVLGEKEIQKVTLIQKKIKKETLIQKDSKSASNSRKRFKKRL